MNATETGRTPGPMNSPRRTFHDAINRLFHWNPEALVAYNHILSNNTRPPKFFDKHLDDSLILKNLVLLPSLVDDLGRVADNALQKIRTTKLHATHPLGELLDWRARSRKEESIGNKVRNERDVQTYYSSTTAIFCAPVASTLALSSTPHSIQSSLLFTSSILSKVSADPDCALRVVMDKIAPERGIGPRKREQLNKIVHFFGVSGLDTVLFEFKSVEAGNREFMEAVLELAKEAGVYPWQRCINNDCGPDCIADHGQTITGARMGFDAKYSPWNATIRSSGKAKRNLTTKGNTTTDRKRKQSDINSDDEEEDESSLPPPPPARTSTDSQRKHAMDMIQQVWAELVQHDATIVVLNSGNYEFICVRHRQSNTLYISDLIHTPTIAKPHYGKLHTGIYIAGINDAIDRAALLEEAEELPRSWTRTTWEAQRPTLQDKEHILELAHNSTTAVLYSEIFSQRKTNTPFLHFSSRNPLLLTRGEQNTRNLNRRQAMTGPSIRLITGAEIDAHIYPATLSIGDHYLDEPVIVKVVHGGRLIANLRIEAETYRFLTNQKVKGLVDIIGFYEIDPSQVVEHGRWSILVMKKFGNKLGLSGPAPRDKFMKALSDIHAAGVLHGPLRREHLLALGSEVAIIGFGDSMLKVDTDKIKDTDKEEEPALVGGSRFEKMMVDERAQMKQLLKRYHD